MRGMDGVILNGQGTDPSQHNQPQAAEATNGNVNRQQPQINTGQHQGYPPDAYGYVPQNGAGSYPSPQIYYTDEFYGDDVYYQQYLRSPRPSAPIPPTPHSQTAAPSPSPNLAAENAHEYEQAPYPPVPPLRVAGSPFPFPYNHMRRNLHGYSPAPQSLREQMAKQYQKYAQNNQGYVTDSTLSPSSTPFRPDLMYHAWAMHHTKKNVGPAVALDNASITSSPSHKPIELTFTGFRGRKERAPASRRRQSYPRQPPPRVESTQPRETSPELSSSGEETAGDDRPNTAMESHVDEAPQVESVIPIEIDDDNGEWVDEDEEDDYDDLIDLEYHPSFVKNISKRRRKWEVGWENLIQAVSLALLQDNYVGDSNHAIFFYAVPSPGSPNGRNDDPPSLTIPHHQTARHPFTLYPAAAHPRHLRQHEPDPLRVLAHRRAEARHAPRQNVPRRPLHGRVVVWRRGLGRELGLPAGESKEGT